MSQALQIKDPTAKQIGITEGFQYQPLDTTREQIRLVKLRRSRADEHTHVFCNVRTFELAKAPPYIALSYTWGAPEPKRVIFIGDEPYEIRENLFNFLYTYRSEYSNTRYLYIDQLCIDQESPDERNHQVRLMSKIYTRCLSVIVWLDHTTAKAAADFEATHHPNSAEMILRNKYFTRLWIVQEVLLPPEVRVLCGKIWLSWSDLGNVIWKMPDWYLSILRTQDTVSLAWLFSPPRKLSDRRNCLPLDRCVDLFTCMECEDPRDKVYGLLGLANGEEHPEIDYRKPVHEVFLDTFNTLRHTYWKRYLETGMEQPSKHRCATYHKLAIHMGLDANELASLMPFLRAICKTDELVLSRLEKPPSRSPIVSLGFDQGASTGCAPTWWFVYLGVRYEF